MNNKTKDFIYAVTANALNFLMGIVSGLLLPNYLTVDDYGYIKVFLLYITYVGIGHFGFLDGIYIRYGNYNYEDLPKRKFRTYFRFFMVFQTIGSIILVIITALFVKDSIKSGLLYLVAINMILMNATTYFAFIHQITRRFKTFSINTVLTKLLYILGCLALFAAHIYGYMHYVVLQTIVNLVVLIIYIYDNKELVLGKAEGFMENIKEIKENFKIGFLVMIGALMSLIILGMDRIIIDELFTHIEFTMYSFAYTLISLFYILLNSVTMVMYPYLTRAQEEKRGQAYGELKTIIVIFSGFTLFGFFILKFIVLNFLPKYVSSLPILLILTPTVLFNGQISILISNYYKVMKLTKDYTINNIVALILGLVTCVVSLIIYKSTISVAIATVAAFVLWVIYSDWFFIKKFKINLNRSRFIEAYIVIAFFISASFFNIYVGALIYLASIIIVVAVGYKKDVMKLVSLVKEKGSKI